MQQININYKLVHPKKKRIIFKIKIIKIFKYKIENGSEGFKNFPFKTYLSFKPLIEFWEKELLHSNVYKSELVKISLEKIKRIQDLNNPVEDYSIIEKHTDI